MNAREEGVSKRAMKEEKEPQRRQRAPAKTLEARENQLISLAVDLVEKQLKEGTASAQVITHYLKLGSTKDRTEKEILLKQSELLSAKTEALKSTKTLEELYGNALKAMQRYSGGTFKEDYHD